MAHENSNVKPHPTSLVFAKGTDVGRKRGHNEDYVDAFRPSDPEKRRKKGELFIVADGMGGHQAGEVASENAVEATSHEYYASPIDDVPGALVDAVQKANALIHRLAQESPSRAGMGTTVVAAVVRGKDLYLANVGDSRAYLLRNGKLSQVTRDHSFVQDQIEAGILTPEEARTHPQRNVVTRALGSKPNVQVDTFGGKLQPGDTLLLCTDGLSEHVTDQDIAAMLRQYAPKEAVPRLIALANKRGGSDNITVLAIRVGSPVGTTAGAVPPRQAVPTAPSKPAKAGRSLPLALIVGLSAGGLLVAAALVVGFLLWPRLSGGRGEETPQATVESALPTATLPSPSPTESLPTATLKSPTQASTPQGTSEAPAVGPTSTPKVGVSLLDPKQGKIVPPGAEVTFRWEASGSPLEPITFILRTDRSGYEELYEGSDTSIRLSLPTGRYQWWVEMWRGDTLTPSEERRTLVVILPATSTPTPAPTLTTVPPTDTPPPADGGGDDNGGSTTEPPKPSPVPTTPVPEPTDPPPMPTVPSPEPTDLPPATEVP